MAANARGPAGNGASDDNRTTHSQDSPLPEGFIDLGNGRVDGYGDEADMLAAAEWLDRHYPEHSGEPPDGCHGPVLNMGYQLTREARAGMPRGWSMGQRAVVLLLADICNDRTRRSVDMDVTKTLCEELDIPKKTLGNILATLAAAGYEFRVAVGKDKRGRAVFAYKGHGTDYQFPEIPPRLSQSSHEGAANEPVDNSGKGASLSAPNPRNGPRTDGPLDPKVHARMDLNDSKVHPSRLKGPSLDGPLHPGHPKKKTPSLSQGAPVSDPGSAADATAGEEREGRAPVGDGRVLKGKVINPKPAGGLADEIVAAVPGLTLDDANAYIDHLRRKPKVDNPSRVIRAAIKGGHIADDIGDLAVRMQLGVTGMPLSKYDQAVAAGERVEAMMNGTSDGKPPWCGKCDERTRQDEDDQGRPYRCPECHPSIRTAAS